jgi:polar amino acid transport system ATP-binding protein
VTSAVQSPLPGTAGEPMGKPLLRIEDVRKSFGDLQVLKGVSLTVAEHKVVAIIGPSGSGKSTMLRCINRLEEPDSGRIFLGDDEVTARDAKLNHLRRNIGMVFQQFNLYPHLNARDNVALALRKVLRHDKAKAYGLAEAALTRVGLAEKFTTFPGQLSGGQQQRVGIARALAMEPKVVLFDEPTSALDPELVSGVLAVIRDMKVLGYTMVVVTHEMGFARDVADHVIFMDHGQIVEQGPPQALFSAPRSERLRDFLSKGLGH